MCSSKLLSREPKGSYIISYLQAIVMYYYETWSTTKGDKIKKLTYEREVFRRIYGTITKQCKQNNMNGEQLQILRDSLMS